MFEVSLILQDGTEANRVLVNRDSPQNQVRSWHRFAIGRGAHFGGLKIYARQFGDCTEWTLELSNNVEGDGPIYFKEWRVKGAEVCEERFEDCVNREGEHVLLPHGPALVRRFVSGGTERERDAVVGCDAHVAWRAQPTTGRTTFGPHRVQPMAAGEIPSWYSDRLVARASAVELAWSLGSTLAAEGWHLPPIGPYRPKGVKDGGAAGGHEIAPYDGILDVTASGMWLNRMSAFGTVERQSGIYYDPETGRPTEKSFEPVPANEGPHNVGSCPYEEELSTLREQDIQHRVRAIDGFWNCIDYQGDRYVRELLDVRAQEMIHDFGAGFAQTLNSAREDMESQGRLNRGHGWFAFIVGAASEYGTQFEGWDHQIASLYELTTLDNGCTMRNYAVPNGTSPTGYKQVRYWDVDVYERGTFPADVDVTRPFEEAINYVGLHATEAGAESSQVVRFADYLMTKVVEHEFGGKKGTPWHINATGERITTSYAGPDVYNSTAVMALAYRITRDEKYMNHAKAILGVEGQSDAAAIERIWQDEKNGAGGATNWSGLLLSILLERNAGETVPEDTAPPVEPTPTRNLRQELADAIARAERAELDAQLRSVERDETYANNRVLSEKLATADAIRYDILNHLNRLARALEK